MSKGDEISGQKRGMKLADEAWRWFVDKIIPIVVVLMATLLIWIVTRIFTFDAIVTEKAHANETRIHALELRTAERLTCVEQDVKYIRQAVVRIEKAMNSKGGEEYER